MSIIISLLLNLLVSFLIKLIEQWLLNQTTTTFPTAQQLALSKPDFLAKVKWRFWLGPSRISLASKAFDMAVYKYSNLPKLYMSNETTSPAITVGMATDGLAEVLK